ncbi:bromodomain-containing protein 8-like [Aotus nancymaae]|uniref:bromodomain-containing protein 8-like n=1 Tax=Aotus nancymaae TaxID=37293 RepID=UPI0030FE9DB4
MRHEWVWLDSDQDYPNDSELSNDCKSLFSSWNSSQDLDVGSWRETEDPEAEELEESSPGRETSELLVEDRGSEESQEEAKQVSHQNLLHFLSEVAYLMEPLCISSNESSEGCCPPSVTRQEGREIKASEGERELCRETEELSAKGEPFVAEKPLGENGKPEVASAPSDICAVQEPPTVSEEGEAQQESKGEDQGEAYVSEMEDQPPSGECDDAFNIKETPLVDIFFSHATSSKLTHLSQDDPVQDHLLFKKTLLPVWKMIASHRPMDLTTLKRNLSKGRIRIMAQFQRDLMLMFQNAVMYNDSDHHVYHMAVEMRQEVLEQIQPPSPSWGFRSPSNKLSTPGRPLRPDPMHREVPAGQGCFIEAAGRGRSPAAVLACDVDTSPPPPSSPLPPSAAWECRWFRAFGSPLGLWSCEPSSPSRLGDSVYEKPGLDLDIVEILLLRPCI